MVSFVPPSYLCDEEYSLATVAESQGLTKSPDEIVCSTILPHSRRPLRPCLVKSSDSHCQHVQQKGVLHVDYTKEHSFAEEMRSDEVQTLHKSLQ